jgi:hypothetical protein
MMGGKGTERESPGGESFRATLAVRPAAHARGWFSVLPGSAGLLASFEPAYSFPLVSQALGLPCW